MMNVQLGDTIYKIKHAWPDLTLKDAQHLHSMDIPPELKALYAAISEEEYDELFDAIDHEKFVKDFPTYYGKVVAYLGDIPEDVMARILRDERTNLYRDHCQHIVQGIYGFPDIEQTDIKSFTHGKLPELFLPASKEIMGNKRKGAWITTIEFTESADLENLSKQLSGGRYDVAANIISILCRPEDEKYNEDVCLARAAQLADLPMDIVWEVFFSTINSITRYNRDSAISFLQVQKETLAEVARRSKASDGAAA